VSPDRVVFVLRHAKSSWSDPGIADHDRPLSGRGRRSATAVAASFLADQLQPQLVLCSSAERARQTLAPLRKVLPPDTPILIESGLYLATADALLERLRSLDDGVRRVLLVGHNPGLQDLVRALAGPTVLGPAGLPTAALVAIRVKAPKWSALGAGTAGTVSVRVHPGRRHA
jgi:phosphohistidine phosphatase